MKQHLVLIMMISYTLLPVPKQEKSFCNFFTWKMCCELWLWQNL